MDELWEAMNGLKLYTKLYVWLACRILCEPLWSGIFFFWWGGQGEELKAYKFVSDYQSCVSDSNVNS